MARKKSIIWLDVETTGVNRDINSLLQVACRITDENLEFLDESGYEAKIHFTNEEVEELKKHTSDYVIDMHTKTGLWDALSGGDSKPRNVIDTELLTHIQKYVPEAKTGLLGGNSITLDRNFLEKFMPKSFEHLHYRSFDVTTMAMAVEMWLGSGSMYNKTNLMHEAMDDITQSVLEARHYQKLLFPTF